MQLYVQPYSAEPKNCQLQFYGDSNNIDFTFPPLCLLTSAAVISTTPLHAHITHPASQHFCFAPHTHAHTSTHTQANNKDAQQTWAVMGVGAFVLGLSDCRQRDKCATDALQWQPGMCNQRRPHLSLGSWLRTIGCFLANKYIIINWKATGSFFSNEI